MWCVCVCVLYIMSYWIEFFEFPQRSAFQKKFCSARSQMLPRLSQQLQLIRRMSTKKNIACIEDLQAAVRKGALIVDLRTDREIATAKDSVNVRWNRETESMDDKEILRLTNNDQSVPIIVHWGSGGRASRAKVFLEKSGFETVLNGAGPKRQDLWEAYCNGSKKNEP